MVIDCQEGIQSLSQVGTCYWNPAKLGGEGEKTKRRSKNINNTDKFYTQQIEQEIG